ncbi:hypothetical protein C0991_005843 [Blastosporella zonata]|nr:hypothetical protein C0991_005843 [Blastosporella zonata]
MANKLPSDDNAEEARAWRASTSDSHDPYLLASSNLDLDSDKANKLPGDDSNGEDSEARARRASLSFHDPYSLDSESSKGLDL